MSDGGRAGGRPGRSPRVAFLVNGSTTSAMGVRASAFSKQLGCRFDVSVYHREGGRPSAFQFQLAGLRRMRPAAVYVFDLALASIAAALVYRLATGCPMVVETGDAVADLLRSTGRLGDARYKAAAWFEHSVLRAADAVVVRGNFHESHLRGFGVRVSAVVPDGVDTKMFHRFDVAGLRRALGIEGTLTAGVLGSLHWNPRLRWTPGLELVQALARLPGVPLCGLIIGDGTGLPALKRIARELGVSERMRFIDGWTPHGELPRYINCMDVCLSTQTNDVVGWVRTTGKLPLFLACERFVLASRVGDAARVLPDDMLVEYAPGFDRGYPSRLAERLSALAENPAALGAQKRSRAIAEREFEYSVLAPRVASVLESVMR